MLIYSINYFISLKMIFKQISWVRKKSINFTEFYMSFSIADFTKCLKFAANILCLFISTFRICAKVFPTMKINKNNTQ